ncbi:hypothetical protein HYS47_05360 [Candidatus Woesearchaeota archaeon]|nr:hypothetical protein [Candidatus Woesearchaeota archaeon]
MLKDNRESERSPPAACDLYLSNPNSAWKRRVPTPAEYHALHYFGIQPNRTYAVADISTAVMEYAAGTSKTHSVSNDIDHIDAIETLLQEMANQKLTTLMLVEWTMQREASNAPAPNPRKRALTSSLDQL